jgi:hypothetical protein
VDKKLVDPVLLETPYGAVTLRDLFAGLAAVGLLGNPGNNQVEGDFAPFAYAFADAMLAARGPKC